ncbi:MBL fold metallo-hydrolase [Salinithrix halophila]|uniref:MBL fold metallo-hydrolase n=1 Tax=Salinithrix halophila TaxID=1485204 RepID=A0ABV8JCY8_9BACL
MASDVLCKRLFIANVCMIGESGGTWTLVDAGLSRTAAEIIRTAEERFGKGCRPQAIILTHGHFDHVGALETLMRYWDVPVYAHERELPYLTGQSDYLPPDSSVGGGLMARMAPLYPYRGIDLGRRVQSLPPDGSLPTLLGWRWVHTPGHTEGHIALFRDEDRVLIAGDAFTTVKQESAWAVVTQRREVHGPPAYFTSDWEEAGRSVKKLYGLKPLAVATGHGIPMHGGELLRQLGRLAVNFDQLAVPDQGRYVGNEAKR